MPTAISMSSVMAMRLSAAATAAAAVLQARITDLEAVPDRVRLEWVQVIAVEAGINANPLIWDLRSWDKVLKVLGP